MVQTRRIIFKEVCPSTFNGGFPHNVVILEVKGEFCLKDFKLGLFEF